MEEIAMRMSFDDARDAFYGSLETLTENRDQAVQLLALALNKPRFDADAVERMRAQLLAGLAYAAARPHACCVRAVDRAGLCRPSLRPAGQRHASHRSRRSTRDDLVDFGRASLPRTRCAWWWSVTSMPKTLASMLDTIFGALPAKAKLDAGRADSPRPSRS